MSKKFEALVIGDAEGKPRASFRDLGLDDLPDHPVLVKNSLFQLNYNDGLAATGVACSIEGDDLIVEGAGRVRGGGTVATHLDHRIAMSFVVMGLASDQPVTIDDESMIATSFPTFKPALRQLGASL